MQSFPVYTVQADGPGETGLVIEVRVELGAAGGLAGMLSADAVVQALMSAATAAGAAAVSASRADVTATVISPGAGQG